MTETDILESNDTLELINCNFVAHWHISTQHIHPDQVYMELFSYCENIPHSCKFTIHLFPTIRLHRMQHLHFIQLTSSNEQSYQHRYLNNEGNSILCVLWCMFLWNLFSHFYTVFHVPTYVLTVQECTASFIQ